LRVQRFGKGFVEIEIDAFTRTLVLELIGSARDTLRHTRGIVLDLRNNGGGDATAMAEVASLFMPPATPLGQFTDRQGKVVLALGTNAMYVSALDRNRRPPLVILTSERTSSAAEILIAALQHSTNVTVIGGQTCGCVLAVRAPHALPDGGELEVSELDYRTAKGVRLEGLGITPDETVSLSRRDLYAHRDRIREVAVAKLHRSASLN
jgi:carboxyl-terminal processing protease